MVVGGNKKGRVGGAGIHSPFEVVLDVAHIGEAILKTHRQRRSALPARADVAEEADVGVACDVGVSRNQGSY